MAQTWAKQQKLELSIKPLTESTLGYTSHTYPSLEGSVKAARTRVLFEYVTKICLDVALCLCRTNFFLARGVKAKKTKFVFGL